MCFILNRKELEKLFSKFSNESNTCISKKNLKTILQLFGFNPSNRQLNNLLNEKSFENDNLSFDDLKSIVLNITLEERDIKDQLHAAFSILDKSQSGYINQNEFKRIMCSCGEILSQEEFEGLVKLASVNNDGKIKYSGK